MDREEARRVVAEVLRRRNEQGGIEVVAVGDPREFDLYWVQGYQSRAYVQDGDLGMALAGNGPIAVPKDGRPPIELGAARPSEHYIAELELRDKHPFVETEPRGLTIGPLLNEYAIRNRLFLQLDRGEIVHSWADMLMDYRIVAAAEEFVVEILERNSVVTWAAFPSLPAAELYLLDVLVREDAARKGSRTPRADVLASGWRQVDAPGRVVEDPEGLVYRFQRPSDAAAYSAISALTPAEVERLPYRS